MKTTESKNKTTTIYKVALQDIYSKSPSNVVLTLTLLERKGGEMYGM